jgi:hypothetical protein
MTEDTIKVTKANLIIKAGFSKGNSMGMASWSEKTRLNSREYGKTESLTEMVQNIGQMDQ